MQVKLNASVCEEATSHVAKTLRESFKKLELSLSGDYGGIMEHLWIDVELVEFRSKAWPFRFQKRVSGASRLGLPAVPDSFNVGHYSVEPNFGILLSLKTEQISPYTLGLIYDSTEILYQKEKKLGGFNTNLFRKSFLDACIKNGYVLPSS